MGRWNLMTRDGIFDEYLKTGGSYGENAIEYEHWLEDQLIEARTLAISSCVTKSRCRPCAGVWTDPLNQPTP